MRSSAYYATLPFIAIAVFSNAGGKVSDAITRAYGPRTGECLLASGAVLAQLTPWIATQLGWTASFLGAAGLCFVGSVARLAIDPRNRLLPGVLGDLPAPIISHLDGQPACDVESFAMLQ